MNKIYGKGFIKVFAVMLAESFTDNPKHLDGKEFIVTQKLDGVRCVAFVHENGEVQFFTRNGQDYGEVPDVAAAYEEEDIARFRGTAWGAILAASDYDTHKESSRNTGNEEYQFERVAYGMTMLVAAYQIIARMTGMGARR